MFLQPTSEARANAAFLRFPISKIEFITGLPDWAITPLKRFFFFFYGEIICKTTEVAPEPEPKILIRFGSPQKFKASFFIHSKAKDWSRSPKFPGASSVSVVRNPNGPNLKTRLIKSKLKKNYDSKTLKQSKDYCLFQSKVFVSLFHYFILKSWFKPNPNYRGGGRYLEQGGIQLRH